MKVIPNISCKNSNRTFIDNNYTYDILSNVLSVENTATLPGAGEIGGTVEYNYAYDDLNRLETATALFTGRNAIDNGYEQQQYSLLMTYDNLHNIVSKEQLHQKAPGQSGGTFTDIPATTYRLDYTYEAENKPHAPREIIDKPNTTSTGNDVKTKLYDYDANGNLTAITQKTGESETIEKLRTNLWDEENRLRAVDITPDAEGVRPIAIYTYDAGGERILKHSNTSVSIYLNGKKVADTIQTDATLYPSGMLAAKLGNNGSEEEQTLAYTKHYFAGTQRVSSKIGTTENLGDYLYDWFTQGTGGPVDVIGSSFGVLENAEQGVIQVYHELEIEAPEYDSSPVFIPVQSFVHGANENDIYWFHPDHLGSTSYITNLLGEVSQHMEYFAFGETFVEEHRSSNNSPYKFNGKELDEETGWYYYGARYYDPRISLWLSVDPPLVDGTYLNFDHDGGVLNSFNLNSYVYCRQNPVLYTDPDGNQYVTRYIWYDENGNISKQKDLNHYTSSNKYWVGQGTRSRMKNSWQTVVRFNPGIRYVEYRANGEVIVTNNMDGVFPTDHGLYSGAGAIKDAFGNDDFSFRPLDIADAIAKQHDRDYITQGYDSSIGVTNDSNTLQADIDMVERVKNALAGANSEDFGFKGQDSPITERIYSRGITQKALTGQLAVISLLRDFKQWKVDNGYKRTDSILDKSIYKAYRKDVGWGKAQATKKIGNATKPE